MNVFISNIQQSALKKAFWMSVLLFVIIMYCSAVSDIVTAFRSEELLTYGFHNEFILNTLRSDTMVLIVPIICALPYTTAFLDDVKSGFIKEYLPRTTIKDYILGKILACYLSGGLVIFIGIFCAYGLSALVFSPMEAAATTEAAAAPLFLSELFNRSLTFFFAGGFLSLLGMLFATVTNSKYMAYASPFIVYYVLIILKERYFDGMYVLYPKEWLNPSDKWILGNWGVIFLLLECALVAALCFTIAAKRRIERI